MYICILCYVLDTPIIPPTPPASSPPHHPTNMYTIPSQPGDKYTIPPQPINMYINSFYPNQPTNMYTIPPTRRQVHHSIPTNQAICTSPPPPSTQFKSMEQISPCSVIDTTNEIHTLIWAMYKYDDTFKYSYSLDNHLVDHYPVKPKQI